MSAGIPFNVENGRHQTAVATYLPFGTRTLRFEVTNKTEAPCLLWLRPQNLPANYPATGLIRGYVDGQTEDRQFWVHWAGGDERGACVKMDEKSPLEDKTLKVWEVKPVAVAAGESCPVFMNVSHLGTTAVAQKLTLQAITLDGTTEKTIDSTLTIDLQLPATSDNKTVTDAVRGTWSEDGTELTFSGTQLPDYVSRWWPPDKLTYRPAPANVSKLRFNMEQDKFTLKLDGKTLATIKDNDWEAGQDIHKLRPCQPELFHFCGDRYYVVRFWFIWTDKSMGQKHEVPDAERIDVLFDQQANKVLYMGTDFHYKETWGRLKAGQKSGKIELGLGFSSIDNFTLKILKGFFDKGKVADPARQIARQLCEAFTWQTGPKAHVPMLANISLFGNLTSPDVREG